ncbi:MAG: CehA/McbA family metallohydrolase [Acidimicrobiales bacterium]
MADRLARFHGRWMPEDRAESTYRYLAFELPGGVEGISFTLDYDRSAGVLDLGLFAPFGFRGWSGGVRSSVIVSRGWATPGYLPGELEPGCWSVCLGLYRIPDSGLEYTVEVSRLSASPMVEPGERPPLPERPPRRLLPSLPGRRWLAGDFHTHSVHSDGALEIMDLALVARSRGLDFLAVTDHNTVSHHPYLRELSAYSGVELLPGQELTTDEGHANCFGRTGWIDFRRDADQWLSSVERAGGVLSINHPVDGDLGWRRRTTAVPPLAEVWHSSWDRRSKEPLAWWMRWGCARPIGGSDFHRVGSDKAPGSPTTWIEVADDGILPALRTGRVCVSEGPSGPVVMREGSDVLVIGGEGTWLTSIGGRREPVRSDAARLTAVDGLQLLTDDTGQVLALTL